MNKKQKICLWVGIAAIVLMGLFPPWHIKTSQVSSQMTFGYAFLLTPPETAKKNVHPMINIPQLVVQWVIVSTITGGLIYSFKDKKPKDEQKQ